jgi:hypothetical protein
MLPKNRPPLAPSLGAGAPPWTSGSRMHPPRLKAPGARCWKILVGPPTPLGSATHSEASSTPGIPF